MSIIRSQPYSRQGRANWDDIFGKKPLTPSEQVNQIVEQVRTANNLDEVHYLQEDLRRVTSEMNAFARRMAFGDFAINIPASLISKE